MGEITPAHYVHAAASALSEQKRAAWDHLRAQWIGTPAHYVHAAASAFGEQKRGALDLLRA